MGFLDNGFIRTLIAGLAVAAFTPMIGTFMVLRRYALIADSLAHVALAGVAIGMVTGALPTYIAFAVTVAAAMFIEYLRENRRVSGDSALALLVYGGLAVAVVLFSAVGKEVNEDLLFGSLETVKAMDVVPIIVIGTGVVTALALFWKELVYSSFDEETARVQGVPVRFVNMLLVILTAVTVSFALKVVGVLLVGALMIIPVTAAAQFGRSFRSSAFLAVVVGVLSVVGGLAAAARWHLAAGGSVALVAFACFFIALGIRKLRRA
jgi:zinc transport system permease protein